MLIRKKIIHLNHLIKNNLFSTTVLTYKICLWAIFINRIAWSLFSKRVIIPSYHYALSTISFDKGVINSTLLNILNVLIGFKNKVGGINFDISLGNIKQFRKDFTVLRSRFVHKKTREQLFVDNFAGKISIKISKYNFYIIKYLDFFLKKNLKGWVSSRGLLKRSILNKI